MAQNSAQAPAQSAAKTFGGDADSDPSGAVRALGSGDDRAKKDRGVTVPRLGGEGRHPVEGLPPGTSGSTR